MTATDSKLIPLDEAAEWQGHHAYFAELGVEAWLQGKIPSLSTSSYAFATQIAGLLDAHLEAVAGDAEVVHVLEVGGGLGRFAANLCRALDHDLGEVGKRVAARVRLIYSDYAETTVRQAIAGPELAPLVAAGRVVPMLYDLRAPASLHDLDGGVSGVRPLAIICNYVCCVLPARYLQKYRGRWAQLMVSAGEPVESAGHFVWDPVDLASLPDGELAARVVEPLDPATLTVPSAFLTFLRGVQPLLDPAGAVLITDFGRGTVADLAGIREIRPIRYGDTLNNEVSFAVFDAHAAQVGHDLVRTEDPLLSVQTAMLSAAPIAAAVRAMFADRFVNQHVGQDLLDFAAAGRMYLERGEHAQAVRYFARALRYDPRNAELHLRAGIACVAFGLHQTGINLLQSGQALDAWHRYDFNLALAHGHRAVGELNAAVESYRRAIADFERPATLLELAVLLAEMGYFEDAYHAHGRAETLAPGSPEVSQCLATLQDMWWKRLGQGT